MASSGAWYREGTVTVTNGSASITGVNTDWLTALIAVAIGDIFTVDSKTWYEIVNVSADTGITLDRNFEGATVAGVNYAIIRNTSGTVLTRIAGQVAVQFNQKQLFLDELRTWLNSTNATEMVTDSHGVSTAITTPTQMASEHSARVAQVDTLVNGISAMTKAEFFALAEQRKSQSAGSGFSDWGNHYSASGVYDINDGMWADNAPLPNALNFGFEGDIISKSRTKEPILNANGHLLHFKSAVERFTAKFPTAPDGTKTYDSSTGTVTQHASTAIAFAAETATNKVITSRQDFVFIEPWHEKISDKGVVYPLGNVQYGGTTYEGITLAVNGIAQGYSAFGEWDSTTTGNCAVWANLTDAQKATFIQDHKNNIYSDNGELIQVRYRVRVVEGLGDNWSGLETEGVTVTYPSYGANRLKARGSSVVVRDLGVNSNAENQLYGKYSQYGLSELQGIIGGKGHYISGKVTGGLSVDIAHDGLCFAIPLCIVQRRNQGAYHPSYNPNGSGRVVNISGAYVRDWYNNNTGHPLTSIQSCFQKWLKDTQAGSVYGFIGITSGRPDGKFYDAIYASDVKDLRMSSKKLPLKEIREKYKRMAIAGEVRGFEGASFLREFGTAAATITNDDYLNVADNSIYNVGDLVVFSDASGTKQEVTVLSKFSTNVVDIDRSVSYTSGTAFAIHELQQHSQVNPTWTDIIGDPAKIAATFPDGVEGQWIPEDVTTVPINLMKLNRKSLGSLVGLEQTSDNGATWFNGTDWGMSIIDPVTNTFGGSYSPAPNAVRLAHYETKAHFTQDDVIGEELDKSISVIATNNHNDAVLVSSLTDNVSTGTDALEELTVTKTVNGVVSHTAESMQADVLFTSHIENDNGVAKFVFNIDDSGVIDGSKVQSFNTQYFITEE